MKRIAIAFLIGLMAQAVTAQAPAAAAPANSVPCPAIGQEIASLPEADADPTTHILQATIYTAAEQVRLTDGVYGKAVNCYPQWIREYKLMTSPTPPPASTSLPDPTPGPLLRASIGDLVQITFLNLIDPNKFPNSDSGC